MIERGSIWRKWDFHVHTPYSVLNNEFKRNAENEEEFDDYVKILFTKAVEKGIAAIGITDYFSMDGYKRIKQDYLCNDSKMRTLFSADLLSKVRGILVFPNIELRLNTFVGEERQAVNYHVIFSNETDIEEIESGFFQRLEIKDNYNTSVPLTRKGIEKIGKIFKERNNISGSDYEVGLKHVVVDPENVVESLNNSEALRDKYYIVLAASDHISKISWNGRDAETRRLLYQQCQFMFNSNPGDREWFLGKKGYEKDAFISEFGSLKPCIWGSDAHSEERLFCPDYERFCWIKADATFEGLRQVLYEPEDRVKIQKDCPEEKDEHQLIDYIKFNHEDFQTDPIYFSDGLTTIIGGKSTGKSILLRHIAKGIDPKQVEERESAAPSPTEQLDAGAQVVWRDNVAGERRIIYIPQSWLNRIVDDSSGGSQLNKILERIILQQDSVEQAKTILDAKIERNIEYTRDKIHEYVKIRDKIISLETRLRECGRSEAFCSTINRLEQTRDDLSLNSGITDEKLKKYYELKDKIVKCTYQLERLKKESDDLEQVSTPIAYIHGITRVADLKESYDLDSFTTTGSLFKDAISTMNEKLREMWEPIYSSAQTIIQEQIAQAQERGIELETEFDPLNELVSQNEQLKKVEAQLNVEREKLRNAETIEKEKRDNEEKAKLLQKEIIECQKVLRDSYRDFAKTVCDTSISDSELVFAADVGIKNNDLLKLVLDAFNNRSVKRFDKLKGYAISDEEIFNVEERFFEDIWDAMNEGSLEFKGGYDFRSALEGLFRDWFYIHYIVKSGDDTINDMSPGKKALVLLEMIVNLEKGKCPILIDQPEDDLDNRSIYHDLVAYLKAKKHERQIILVTHNANVVVGADAEAVIIANQDGKRTKNRSKRFEYRCGAIENILPLCSDDGKTMEGVLNEKGIQEQICDILEGGREALELRRKKYINK